MENHQPFVVAADKDPTLPFDTSSSLQIELLKCGYGALLDIFSDDKSDPKTKELVDQIVKVCSLYL